MDVAVQGKVSAVQWKIVNCDFDAAYWHSETNWSDKFVCNSAGNDDIGEPEKVSAAQWKVAQCLRWLLKQNRHDADRAFARIMSGMCHIRELSVAFYQWVQTNPFAHYSQIQNNSLLAEWFSNSWVLLSAGLLFFSCCPNTWDSFRGVAPAASIPRPLSATSKVHFWTTALLPEVRSDLW